MTRSNLEEQSVLNFPGRECVHCSIREPDDLMFLASRASLVLVERHGGGVRPPMSLFARRLEAMGLTSRRLDGDGGSALRRSQLTALYFQICSKFDVHALSGLSADEDTVCMMFADPSMLEYDVWLETRDVRRIMMP